jgi:hypothetical protein
MAAELQRDPDLEWLDHIQPVGLVVAPIVLKELGLTPSRQTQVDTAALAEHVKGDSSKPLLTDVWTLFQQVLGWEAQHVAGSPDGPAMPDEFYIRLPEHDTTLSPTWAVKDLGNKQGWQLLVRLEVPGVDPDARGTLDGWEATAHQRFERLLRESGVLAGLLISEKKVSKDGEDRYWPELRLIYAPRGETSGHLSFPVYALATVSGRPMLGGLKLLLDSFRLWNDAADRRLPSLLQRSRDAQAAVSTALAEQVLGALHELLRGLDAAVPDVIRELARNRPGHLYEGLLTVLMRLVFVLYAEDRDLLPSRTDGRAREIYETSYSARGLYAKLTEDTALNPDTMDERRGGWGQLLSLFRLIHKGHPSRFVQARGGKLFDPDQFPFLEGRRGPAESPRVLLVSDGCILRILESLMTLQVKGGTRERLSYRTLDVEQIGSVYETVMGFTVEIAAGRTLAIKAGKNNRTPVYVNLEQLVTAKGKDRIKYLKEEADRVSPSASVITALNAAKTVEEMASALDPIVDERGSPKKHEMPAGKPILQPTDERRRTGSHYTPRSLTEPIVRHALEPTFERLGPEARPEQILSLKVCDPAMGSGAFLVEACRALATRLVDAWARYPEKKPIIPVDEDEELHARRLIAQRCLYGVDKNPLATDLAKLSLWLATLARDHEFTFLDHALKSGDSLVGLTQEQIGAVHWDTSKLGLPLFQQMVKERIIEVMKGRVEIQAASDDTSRNIQEARHSSLEARLSDIRLMGDAVIAAFFSDDKPRARETQRAEVESWLSGSMEPAWEKLAALASTMKQGQHLVTPFHWEIEFPEVFAQKNGGFDAVIGNPPFLGGTWISGRLGNAYLAWVKASFPGTGNRADLVAYFFRRAFDLANVTGCVGLIATNTIRQGDTKDAALKPIRAAGGCIYRAIVRYPWPGEAAVTVSIIHLSKSKQQPNAFLNEKPVVSINSFLVAGEVDENPRRLAANANRVFKGVDLYGMGFTFDDTDKKGNASTIAEMKRVIAAAPNSASRIQPYIGGEEIVTDPRQSYHRFAINLSDLEELQARDQYALLMDIVERKVRPGRQLLRDTVDGIRLKKRWWTFNRSRPEMYQAIAGFDRVLACSQVAVHLAVARLPANLLFANYVIVFAFRNMAPFTVLQSGIHEIWTRFFSSTLEDRLRYTPSDCFETFPFSGGFESSPELEAVGQAYYDSRATLMIARNEGMTKTYNRFHNRADTSADIQHLRELHAAMDRSVFEDYGWHDLVARAEPIFLDETNEDDHTYQGRLFWPLEFRDEVLSRLLALNAERNDEEIRLGIAPRVNEKEEESEDNEDSKDELKLL